MFTQFSRPALLATLLVLFILVPSAAAQDAPPQVTIREADGKRITLTTHDPSLNEALFVSETGGKTGVQGLRMTISPLRAPGNETAVLNQPAPVDLAPGSSAVVSITGKIPSVAEYRGVLRVEAGAAATEYDLVVQRQAMTATVRMEAVPPVQRMVIPVVSRATGLLATAANRNALVKRFAPDLANLLISLASVDIPITLVETSGGTAEVYYPALTRLTAVDDDDTVSTAQHGDPTLFECGGSAAPVTDKQGQPNLLTLESYQTACLRLAIPGLGQAGKYTARLDLRSPTGGNSSADVPIRLKDHWILAAAVIFLGALLSYSLRSWLTIGRPTQIKSLNVARHEEKVSETIPDADDPIRLALLRKLADLRSQMQVDSSLDVDAELKSVVAYLNDYSVVRAVVEIDVDQSVPLEHRGDARKEIEAIRALLQQADPLAQLAAAKTKAAALREQISQWNRQALQQGIAALTAAMAADGERLPKLGLDQGELNKYLTDLAELKKGLPTAEGAAAAIEKDFEGERRRYQHAADGYARLAPKRLRLIIAGQKRPRGFKETAEWEGLQKEWLKSLDALDQQSVDLAALQDGVDKLHADYLDKVITKLVGAAEDLEDQYETQGNTDRAKGMREAAEILAKAKVSLGSDDLEKAEELYLAGAERFDQALPDGERGKMQAGPQGQAAPGTLAPALGGMAPVARPGRLPPEAKKVTEPATVADIVADTKRRDQRALYIVSLVSVVIGISLLWVPDKTFGGLADYIAVFLWGFGLHQLNAVALPQAVRGQELPWFPALPQGQQQGQGQKVP